MDKSTLDLAVEQDPRGVFVFGSNEAGIHGAGAAASARQWHGAIMGRGYGPHGRSYAIPTKDRNVETLALDQIREYVERFIRFVERTPNRTFYLTRIGCGLAGYTDAQIAPMFQPLYGRANVVFPEEWSHLYEMSADENDLGR